MTLFSTLLLASCEHKDLCYNHPHGSEINLVFDWSDAPDANPASMCVYFYPDGGDESDEPYIYYMIGNVGTKITVPDGTYSVIAYNNDTDGVSCGDYRRFAAHYLFTFECSILGNNGTLESDNLEVPRPDASKNERVVMTPNRMWGCAVAGVKVKSVAGTVQTITLYPHELTCNYTFEVRNVTNLQSVAQMNAAISGMASELTVADETLGSEAVTMALNVTWEGSTITGQFYTFGYNEDINAPKQLMLYVWSNDGSKHTYGTSGDEHFNVTEQILSAPDKRNVHFVVDGLELHEAQESTSGGYSTSVDDWAEESSTIYL